MIGVAIPNRLRAPQGFLIIVIAASSTLFGHQPTDLTHFQAEAVKKVTADEKFLV